MVKNKYTTALLASLVFTFGSMEVYAQSPEFGGMDMMSDPMMMGDPMMGDSMMMGDFGMEEEIPVEEEVVEEDTTDLSAVPVPPKPSFEEVPVVQDTQMVLEPIVDTTALPSEKLLGAIDNEVFREMAAIERETALLSLKSKKEKLVAEIEASKALQRKNQLDELERREQITRNRANWEIEQEQALLQRRIATDPTTGFPITTSAADMAEDITTLYTVDEIKGVGSELFAVLLSSQGGSVNVKEGYPLKNGFKVSKVTTSFVEVRRGNEVAILSFADSGVVPASGSSAPR